MKSLLRGLALLLSILVVVPVLLAQDAKKDAAKNAKDAPKDVGKDPDKPAPPAYVKAGSVRGQIAGVNESNRVIRLKIPALNPGEAQGLMQAQQQLAMARTAQQAQQAQQKIMQHQAKLYSSTQEVQIGTLDEIQVRMANPPTEFDEKGQPKKHTKEELIKLKGDPKLPGYKGEFSDLQTGQIVEIILVRRKDAPVARPKVPMKPKDNKDADPELVNDAMPQTNFIVILQDVRPGG